MMQAQYGEFTSALDLDVDWIGYSNTILSDVGDFLVDLEMVCLVWS